MNVGHNEIVSWWKSLRPTPLSADDRADLIHEVEDGASVSRRYLALTIIATLIASFGLITNSVATIVGAMIIEPSIGPIMGLALGLVRFNWRLKIDSLVAIILGVLISVAIGYLSAKAPVDMGLTAELKVRSMPTLIDMFIAFASGLAAGYAYINPKVNPALAGVAVSVSLVPPLAASGYFLAHGMPAESRGAFLMFFANFICIQLAAVLMFAFYRIGTIRKANSKAMYVLQFAPYLLMTLMVGAYLQYMLADLVAISRQKIVVRDVFMKSFGVESDDLKLDVRHDNDEIKASVVLPIRSGLDTKRIQLLKDEIAGKIGKNLTLKVTAYPVDVIEAQ